MRRTIPWIHRFSRPLIGAIAALGVVDTAYLTSIKFAGGKAACASDSCNAVLSSPYANIFGFPLSLFGLLAYLAVIIMAILPLFINAKSNKKLHNQLQDLTWMGLQIGSTSMMVFSGYLMYLLAVVLKAPCTYCIASAVFAALIFMLVLIGREWEEIGKVVMNGVIAGFLTLLVTLGIFASVGDSIASETPTTANIVSLDPKGAQKPPYGWTITSQSGESELALTAHLKNVGAKMYGGWFCNHCFEQKQLLGREAVKASLPYIECHAQGDNPQVETCQKEGIKGFPTWDIKGVKESGVLAPEKLAELSGYTGPQNFRYSKLLTH
jgi:uncharacterized membrane protein